MNHDQKQMADKVALIGELEHIARHAKLAYIDTKNPGYLQSAELSTSIRRTIMADMKIEEPDWCLAKAAASAKQLAIEIGIDQYIDHIDALTSAIWQKATGVDISGCESCKEDKNEQIS